MLSKSQARTFFLVGTGLCSLAFVLLTVDTFKRIPKQTNQHKLTPEAIRGKHLFDTNNCMGCHTIMGEGAYYAPELTKVYERRGEAFIKAMLTDPEAMYPGQRKMQKYNFSEVDKTDLIAFLKWVGEIDLNGFPPKPDLAQMADSSAQGPGANGLLKGANRPMVFNQMCVACHMLGNQGGQIGPALDGLGSRLDAAFIKKWLEDPASLKADSRMPKLPLTPEQITELTAFLSLLKETK